MSATTSIHQTESKMGTNLRDAVRQSVERFLQDCGELPPSNVYRLVLEQVEEPMLQVLMERANNNQCEVTRWLGKARGTVRKKLKQYGLIK